MKKAVFLRTSSKPIPRVKRVVSVANELGYESLFLGAKREVGLPENDTWDGLDLVRVGAYYPMLNGAGLVTYVKGVISYNYHAFKKIKSVDPDVIHFSDVESFPCVFFYSLMNRVKRIYNIHDNFGQRYPLPKFVNTLLNYFEGAIVSFSHATMVPEEFRAKALPKFCRKKVKVVRNTPIDPGVMPHNGIDVDKIKVVFAGWLDEGRGINTIIELAKLNSRYEVHIAGEGSKAIVDRVKSTPNCIYHGFLNHEQVLKLTAECDFVFAHYSPHRIINIYAAPNKLAESLAVGRPVIINQETKVASTVKEYKCGIVTEYGNFKVLDTEIMKLVSNRDEYISYCQSARDLFNQEYSWESVRQGTIEVFKSLES